MDWRVDFLRRRVSEQRQSLLLLVCFVADEDKATWKEEMW